jgi:AcrR family transcriptional regulator
LPPRASAKRDHLVATAWRLFYHDGYRAVGIDTVLAEAEVAKMTLYYHFASKDELIVAVLEKRSLEVLAGLRSAAFGTKGPPTKQLLALFDWLADWYATDEFRGCAFIRALSEFPEVNHPVHQAAWRHKEAMKEILVELGRAAGAKDPNAVGEALRLVIDGSLVAAHASGSPAPALQAKTTAALLIKAARA